MSRSVLRLGRERVEERGARSLALGELHAYFGLQDALLAIEYGIDLEEELAWIVPPELRGEIDERRDG